MKQDRYPVLDKDATINGSKLAEWIRAGRGVNVWENADLSSPDVGLLVFTPGDVGAPHWRYVLKEGPIHDLERFMLYLRIGTASRLFGGEQSSWNAAKDVAARLDEETISPRDAPIGKVWTAYTVEYITYETRERVAMPDNDRPLASLSGYQVIRWSAIDRAK